MKDEKSLNEGLENDSENQDNMSCVLSYHFGVSWAVLLSGLR